MYPYLSGSIEVVVGPMFSGKTEELIRRVRRAQIARQKIQVFRPIIDNRYHEKDVVSHTHQQIEAIPVNSSLSILTQLLDSTRVVAIDEVQFFDENIITVVSKLARRGYRVICAGLDLDYRGVPFGPIPTLLALADQVLKLQAICSVCGAQASRTFRLNSSQERILVGESNHYEARCRGHFESQMEEDQLPLQEELNFGPHAPN